MNEFSFKRCALGSMTCAPEILRTLGSTFQSPFVHIFTSSFHFLIFVRIILFFNFLFLIIQLIIFFRDSFFFSFIFFSNFISSIFSNCYFCGNLPCFSCFCFLLSTFFFYILSICICFPFLVSFASIPSSVSFFCQTDFPVDFLPAAFCFPLLFLSSLFFTPFPFTFLSSSIQ